MNAPREVRACPACGGRDRALLHRQRFAIIEGVSVLDGYDVVACDSCGATFADRIPSQAELDTAYVAVSRYAYPQRGGKESAWDAARLALTAEAIAAVETNRAARVLDVGCASGRLLAELRRQGFERLQGIDPSPDAVAAGRRIHQVSVEALTLAEQARRPDRFDLVLLVGVLEHLRDVGSALSALGTLLAADGRIYLEVPDVTRFDRWPNAPYQELSVEHVNFFSRSSLAHTLAYNGWSLERADENSRVVAVDTTVSNLSAVAVPRPGVARPDRDATSRPAMERYLLRSAAADRRLRQRIRSFAGPGEPIAIWGVGTLTLRLIAAGAFDDLNVVCLTDSNPSYHGTTVSGVRVVAPASVGSLAGSVVISSWGFRAEIEETAAAVLGPECRLLSLFDGALNGV